MRTRRAATIPVLLAGVLVLTACGDDGGDTDPAAAGDQAADDEAAGDEAATAGVAVASTDLGDVLVDPDGMTLYLFTPDEQGESTCYDDCEAAWPPLTVEAEPGAGDGVDAGLLGTTEREDGSLQVTYNDWPLYLWQGDAEPGDVTGQNVNDVWFVVSPDGDAVTETPSALDDAIQY
jgi:predicted lipoprotein with Yx(FWY)xxD motif